MVKKLLFLALAMVFSITITHPENSYAFGMHRTDHGAPWGADITPEQRSAVQKILEKNWNENSSVRQALASKYEELNTILVKDNPDSSKIETLSREIGELRGKILESRVKVRSELEKLGLPTNFYSYHEMRGHDGSWHIGGYGPNHGRRPDQGFRGGRYGCGAN